MKNLISYYFQISFISLILINHFIEIYLCRRQFKTFKNAASHLPQEFSQFISLEDHQKAIKYSSSKLFVSQIRLLFDATLLLYWFPFRGAQALYSSIPLRGIHQDALFLILFILIQFGLGLPWSIFSTFWIEEKFGFNKTTPKLFIKDQLKGLILGGIFLIPIMYLILYLFNAFSQSWWWISFLVMTGFQFFLLWIYPTWIAPIFNKFSPLESEELKNGISQLVQKAGFKAKEIFIMDASKRSSHGNAYFTGLGKNKRVVFFDTLLKQLSHQEILAILAHELGHMKLKHIPKSMLASIGFSFFGFWLMGMMAQSPWFYQGHFFKSQSAGILIFLFTQAIPLYLFWFSPLSSWLSRRREFEADAYAAENTKSQHLIKALLKLYQQNSSPVITDKWYSRFYHSHPPALERIKHLESLKT
jgi:STE24 endopeptidase